MDFVVVNTPTSHDVDGIKSLKKEKKRKWNIAVLKSTVTLLFWEEEEQEVAWGQVKQEKSLLKLPFNLGDFTELSINTQETGLVWETK